MADSPNSEGITKRSEVELKITGALRSLLDGGTPWASVTVDAITKEAELKRTLFYIYFADRNAVLIRLGNQLIETTVQGIEAHWLVAADGPDSLRKEMEAFWRTQEGFSPVLRALMEGATVDPELKEYWKTLSRAFVEPTKRRIEQLREAGHQGTDADPEMLALCLILMAEKVLLEGLQLGGSSNDELVNAAFELWRLVIYGS